MTSLVEKLRHKRAPVAAGSKLSKIKNSQAGNLVLSERGAILIGCFGFCIMFWSSLFLAFFG